ncbi:NAD(P)/FAD-dependent oxidoreductase [Psychroflexus salis]|nr:NAD(P)/FAD-dependent oxidoreductase [Psychroflexus salis]
MKKWDVIIMGGGLAGLTAAIHLAQQNNTVLVFERHQYPRHKVCGEYVSNEIIPYLEYLHIDIKALQVPEINELLITSQSGKEIQQNLSLGGFGISRYTFDELLYKKALSLGVKFIFEKVKDVFQTEAFYQVTSQNYTQNAELVLGSFGKRSNLDQHFNRNFIAKPAHWVGIKAHYSHPNFAKHKVELHNFNGGYCGLSLTETNHVNVCYLAKYESFKQYKNIDEFNENVLKKNKHLNRFFDEASLVFEKHLAIAQVSFEAKQAVENNILMLGDAAGLIHPLCGNGMAMAIHSAKIASEAVLDFQKHQSKSLLFETYSQKWQQTFQKRMRYGRFFQKLLMHDQLTNIGIEIGTKVPFLVKKMIQQTHGKPIVC